MKKIYTSPSAEVHTINAIQMIANSIDKDSQGITNPDDYDFLGREGRVTDGELVHVDKSTALLNQL